MIRIFNQGTDTLGKISIKDYIPNGFQFFALENPEWSSINMNEVMGVFSKRMEPGDSADFHIYLNLKPGSRPKNEWINFAEIISSFNSMGMNRTGFDIDSKENSNNSVERSVIPFSADDDNITSSGMNGEEDDHDPAMPIILDLALMKYHMDSRALKYEDTVTFFHRYF